MVMGRTHSIRPLFSTTVDPHSRHGRHPTLTPRNDVAPGNDDDDDDNDDDDDEAAAAACCWRIFATSRGVTARATAMEPSEPDIIRGTNDDDDDDDDDDNDDDEEEEVEDA